MAKSQPLASPKSLNRRHCEGVGATQQNRKRERFLDVDGAETNREGGPGGRHTARRQFRNPFSVRRGRLTRIYARTGIFTFRTGTLLSGIPLADQRLTESTRGVFLLRRRHRGRRLSCIPSGAGGACSARLKKRSAASPAPVTDRPTGAAPSCACRRRGRGGSAPRGPPRSLVPARLLPRRRRQEARGRTRGRGEEPPAERRLSFFPTRALARIAVP
jgi:hypothetical protein